MLMRCKVDREDRKNFRRDKSPPIEMDGALWEGFSDEYNLAYYRVRYPDGRIEWYRIC
jgi:hypothetical protein